MAIDFGKLIGTVTSARDMSANRDISPISSALTSYNNFNTGSVFDSVQYSQAIKGNLDDFVWGIHKWDDLTNKVT